MKNIFLMNLILLCASHAAYGMLAATVADADTDAEALSAVKFRKTIGADINALYTGDKKEYQRMTALQIACLKGYADVVDFIVSVPGKHTYPTVTEHPLLIAVKNCSGKNYRDITRLLILFSQKNINTTDEQNRTPLHIATIHNNKEAVEELLDHPAILIDEKDKAGNTPLHIACTNGFIDIVELLLAKNANVNVQNKELKTPLYDASANGRTEIVLLLLTSGANPALADKDEKTPLHRACESNHPDVVNTLAIHNSKLLLVKDKTKHTPLNYIQSEEALINTVKLLISVKAEDAVLSEVLYFASEHNYTNIVKLLLDNGVQPTMNHMEIACQKDHIDVIDMLLQHNPLLLNTKNQFGGTPLHIACQRNSHNVTRLLLTHPAIIVYATDNDLRTPLHDVCHNGNAEYARLLLRKDFEGINMQTAKGNTALHLACEKGDAATIKMLVEQGASSTTKNNNQHTPLAVLKFDHFRNLDPATGQQMVSATDSHNNTQFHLCAIGEVASDSAVQFLTQRGVSVWTRNKDDKIAADVACDEYHYVLQQYYAKSIPLMKSMLDKQERLMHHFLRTTSQYTSCATFKKMFTQSGLLSEVQKQIMHYFYKLNIETIVARTYRDNNSYYNFDIHKKDIIRNQLHNNPEHPHLLWRDTK